MSGKGWLTAGKITTTLPSFARQGTNLRAKYTTIPPFHSFSSRGHSQFDYWPDSCVYGPLAIGASHWLNNPYPSSPDSKPEDPKQTDPKKGDPKQEDLVKSICGPHILRNEHCLNYMKTVQDKVVKHTKCRNKLEIHPRHLNPWMWIHNL